MDNIKLLNHAKWYGWEVERNKISYTTSFYHVKFSIEFNTEDVLVSYLEYYASKHAVNEICGLVSANIKSKHKDLNFSWSEVITEEKEFVNRCKALVFEHTLDLLGFPSIEESISLLQDYAEEHGYWGEVEVAPFEDTDLETPITANQTYFGDDGYLSTQGIYYGDEYLPYVVDIPFNEDEDASYYAAIRAAGYTLMQHKS